MDQHDQTAAARLLDELEEALVALAVLDEQEFMAELVPFGLSMLQFQALRILADAEQSLTMLRLAQQLGAAPAVMTRSVDRLVVQGLVARVTDPRDRRRVLVTLTETGQARLAETQTARRRRLAAAWRQLAEADQRAFLRLLRAFTRALGVRRPDEKRRGVG